MRRLLSAHKLQAIWRFAAESHVDWSIYGPVRFIRTNITGTFALLEQAQALWSGLENATRTAYLMLPPERSMARA